MRSRIQAAPLFSFSSASLAAYCGVFFTVFFAVFSASGQSSRSSAGTLTDNQIITSTVLGYDLQYRVYLPGGHDSLKSVPVIYVTDGQWYIESGEMPALLDRLIEADEIRPVIAVFIDNRDPHRLSTNRRNSQFMCNTDYVRFFSDELIPHIDGAYNTQANRTDRVILGLSFGGLNSVCFGIHGHDSFEGIAIQSPAMRPVPSIYSSYEDSTKFPIKVFLSSGTYGDNEESTRRLKRILEAKGYEMKYLEVPFEHNWENWKPLLDDVLLYYFSR